MNNTTVDALKDVYTELGGSAATVASMQTDAEVIEALSALVGSTIELPAVTSDDNGKVLKVIEGAWNKGTDESLPSVISTDAGKALIVDSEGAWGVDDIPSELPSVTSADEGDVLTVNSSGEWDKATLTQDIVNYSVTIASDQAVTINGGKTATDILTDLSNGKLVILNATDNNANTTNKYYYYNTKGTSCDFMTFYKSGSNYSLRAININIEDYTISFSYKNL